MDNKRYGILGMNCVTKDFVYLFSELDIAFIVPLEGEKYHGGALGEIPIYEIKQITENRQKIDKFIICGFDKSKGLKLMESAGYQHMQDYVFESDFFKLLNDQPLDTNNREIVVWGTGKLSERFCYQHPECEPIFFIDSNVNKKEFHGKDVKRLSEIEEVKSFFIVVAVANDEEIESELEDRGMIYGVDYIHVSDYPLKIDDLAKKVFFSRYAYDFKCHTMLNHFEVGRNNTSCCCTTFTDYYLGNLHRHSFEKVWNSKLHKLLCLSNENQTYVFCKRDVCPLFVGQKRIERDKVIDNASYQMMKEYPEVLLLSFDASCNLYCETCRDNICVATDKEKRLVLGIGEKVCEEILPHVKFLIMAGNGEVFSSTAYKMVYESEAASKPTHIRILSNGTLFNETNWKKFKRDKKSKIMLTCSIDAATKETYETIRRGGDFDVLKENMEFASSLRARGKLSYFRINFVVQRSNYREMEQFVRWGLELKADEVFFTRVLNWGTYSKEEFSSVSMMEEDGITPKQELQEILDLPIMHNKIVDMGTIQASLHKISECEITNYYKWELERKVPGLFS